VKIIKFLKESPNTTFILLDNNLFIILNIKINMKEPRRIYNRYNLETSLRLTPDENINDKTANKILEIAYNEFIKDLPKARCEEFSISRELTKSENEKIIGTLDGYIFKINLGKEHLEISYGEKNPVIPKRIEFYQESIRGWKTVDRIYQFFTSIMHDKSRKYLEEANYKKECDQRKENLINILNKKSKEKSE
jgi:hypothetical protein